jgi:hypothetical protein
VEHVEFVGCVWDKPGSLERLLSWLGHVAAVSVRSETGGHDGSYRLFLSDPAGAPARDATPGPRRAGAALADQALGAAAAVPGGAGGFLAASTGLSLALLTRMCCRAKKRVRLALRGVGEEQLGASWREAVRAGTQAAAGHAHVVLV